MCGAYEVISSQAALFHYILRYVQSHGLHSMEWNSTKFSTRFVDYIIFINF